ncbi:MAG: Glycosyl transferase family 2 [Candidatus Amesbacteria bacterium GW2011_GWB1_47_26]|uniref:Glycosyl transferase family 2 n=1 Tax=Candidatus Amesbacteria bacterium GW2011_GWC2_45_19 TaxID=1618366 RepID=A0A0G1PDF1_9BACT|nr:MAG: Glycosyl transferase family 2 [Candidatus Amesbacteria bacterium GW2011_GWC2_45_19]KKU38155.1 MAG: Glycosyl transferase family 2 [Candidatus Amesbacteria bacterium GW2011_GWA1_46_35]KKU69559.1 MAG: Glycosyl transferase family 2 [Microgenomates group bacterium GW2011_GWC1_47_20]KKU74642.1 MAG: Glycosyl transferase family 2 [Candidatus Amesbacteria bacterium GW2011_GWB1_47_26]KKU79979.1 MAG: Glycosyl transferase family 2 [Candidatus Amesbacteria bacterium GW2011_GWA2_47_70]
MLNTIINNVGFIFNSAAFYSQQYFDRYSFLVPLGVIGIWRWSVWMIKEVIGLHYRPKTKEYNAKVSLVIPVYNENPQVFTQALNSWKKNNPSEIIAVIDYTDLTCIEIFKKFKETFSGAKLIITKTPGKRPALADGIKVAKSEIVALVDSDTIWDDNVSRNGLPPFVDPKVAGVATYQSVLQPKTFAQKVFDIQLDLRYRHEYPFLAASGDALVCLSGRTAFYRREVITPMLSDLVNEKFMGVPVISGDDKRLTYLVLAAGWKVAYQSTSHVYTPGMAELGAYLKQRLRWTRNSLRADLSAIFNGWPIRHPALLFFQIDKFLQGFVVILSPIYFFVSIYLHLWIAAFAIFCWWFISRTIKLYYPHLSYKPKNIVILPGYVLYTFLAGILKIYALFTLNTQGWITRWDKSRLPQFRLLLAAPSYLATLSVVLFLTYGVYIYKEHTYLIPKSQREQLLASALPSIQADVIASSAVLGESTLAQKELFTNRYEAKGNENFIEISNKFGVDVNQLYYANMAKAPNRNITPGTILSIPGKDIQLQPNTSLTKLTYSTNPITVQHDKKTNTLLVTGRGRQITLKDIVSNGGKSYLEEISSKIWLAKATIFLSDGITLRLDKNEVEWLKLESNKKGFVMLRSLNSDIIINGVKITSWDTENNDYDKELKDGRSFIMVKDNSRMDIYSSELSYLGYPTSSDIAASPYGVSWKLSNLKLKKELLTGEVINSKFHHNYFGAYTYGATGMLWKGNEFYENVRYGLDPHDDSNGFLVEDNIARDNGSHGIIFSKRSMYNTVRNNISYNNKLHGIMLHEKSDFNIIENNTVTGNTSGIALYRSSNNIVRNNTIANNRHGVRANAGSEGNIVQNNSITGSGLYGIYFYDKANNNSVSNNTFEYNDVGIYIKSDSNNISKNSLINNAVGVYFQDQASNNVLADNQIKQSGIYGIYTKVANEVSNILGVNDLYRNRKDVAGMNEAD